MKNIQRALKISGVIMMKQQNSRSIGHFYEQSVAEVLCSTATDGLRHSFYKRSMKHLHWQIKVHTLPTPVQKDQHF